MELKTIEDIKAEFPTENDARKYLHEIRWGQFASCQYCGNNKCYIIENGERYKCADKNCYKRFRITVKTIFEASNFSMQDIIKILFVYCKGRFRTSCSDFAINLKVREKTAFFLKEKLDYVSKDIDKVGKSTEQLMAEVFKRGCTMWDRWNDYKKSPHFNNPLSIKEITDIGDPKQYDQLRRHTSYYINVYATWMYLDFATPEDILSETFLYLRDNNIKEYNAKTILHYIWKVADIMWLSFLKTAKGLDNRPFRNKETKRRQRRSIGESYVVEKIKQSKDGAKMTRKEIRQDKNLINSKREQIKANRKKRGVVEEFNSHFD